MQKLVTFSTLIMNSQEEKARKQSQLKSHQKNKYLEINLTKETKTRTLKTTAERNSRCKQMETHPRFEDWKTSHCEDVSTAQAINSSLQPLSKS